MQSCGLGWVTTTITSCIGGTATSEICSPIRFGTHSCEIIRITSKMFPAIRGTEVSNTCSTMFPAIGGTEVSKISSTFPCCKRPWHCGEERRGISTFKNRGAGATAGGKTDLRCVSFDDLVHCLFSRSLLLVLRRTFYYFTQMFTCLLFQHVLAGSPP